MKRIHVPENYLCNHCLSPLTLCGGHHGRDHMVVGFTTNYTISVYHH